MDKAKFLENLRMERKSRGLTQERTAAALGVSDKTYSKWETGENEPDIDALCRLSAFYGISPAAFFRGEANESELEGMDAAEAAQHCWRRINDLLLGLRSCAYPPMDAPAEELPIPEAPAALSVKGSEKNVWSYSYRDQMAVAAAGPDANLAMLMLPHEERCRWLKEADEGLEELFRCLGLPGAMRCLYAILTEQRGSLFTPAYLAERAGVTEEEAAAFLAAAEPWEISTGRRYYQEGSPGMIYSGGLTAQLIGLLTLGRIVISANPRWGPRGRIISGYSYVHLPPFEKGEAP